MAKGEKRYGGVRAEVAFKHPILARLERLSRKRWGDFVDLRNRFGHASPIELVNLGEELGVIEPGEAEMIRNNWSDYLVETVNRFGEALHMVGETEPRLNAWVILNASIGGPRILIDNDGSAVDVVLLTPRLGTDRGPISKGVRRWDPGFIRSLRQLHERLEDILGAIKKRKKRKKDD